MTDKDDAYSQEVKERTEAYAELYARTGKIQRERTGLISYEDAEKLAAKELYKEISDTMFKAVGHEILYEQGGREEVQAWIEDAAKHSPEARLLVENAVKRFERWQQKFNEQWAGKLKEEEEQEREKEKQNEIQRENF